MKKLFVAFFLLLSLLLLANVSHGSSRKEEGNEYWKKIMKDEAIPEMLKQLLFKDDDSLVDDQKEHFKTNFDPHPNAIIYHAHAHASTHKNHNTHDHDLKNNPSVLPDSTP